MVKRIQTIKHWFGEHYSKLIFKLNWKAENKNNNLIITSPCYRNLKIDKIKCGKGTYGKAIIYFFGNCGEEIEIGNFCSIGENCRFICGGNHKYNLLSTFPFDVYYSKNKKSPSYSKGKITIEDDVWIGLNVTILSGVKIGKGAVIGASSVVSKDVPPYAIVVGNPAKIIKYRFNDNVIKKLINLDLSKINKLDKLFLTCEISNDNIDDIVKAISEL